MKKIKVLIFDLGGVVIDLHIDRTLKRFAEIAGVDLEKLMISYGQPEFFRQYEKGLISTAEFRHEINEYLHTNLDDAEIDNAWNSMLGEIPKHRVEKLMSLRDSFQLMLLSNTNDLHLSRFNEILHQSSGIAAMDEVFHKVYYSNEVKMRKPDAEIFRHVIDDNALNPAEFLFLDDTMENLKGAQKLGIQTFHVTHPEIWITHFNE
ncbi:MAG: HAD family phosphatase [Cyclobacteriaceae bacterium]|nr:HAD family phosphatase [Cyclobacteriaceae bacterium]